MDYSDLIYVGVRTQEGPFEDVGDYMIHQSVVWDDGEETDIELDGVCALNLVAYDSKEEAIKDSTEKYFGRYTAIIASDTMEYGQDENEIILRDPVVIEVIRGE